MSDQPRSFVKDNALTLGFFGLLVLALIGQAFSGLADVNARNVAEGAQTIGLLGYVTSSGFAVDVAENWQSEYLQFALYIVATTWLVQRGSSESKEPGNEGLGSDEEQKVGEHADADSPSWARAGGWRTKVYGRSLSLIMGFFFLMSLLAQSVAGHAAFNNELLGRREDPISWAAYLTGADFWNRALQNWQSEFLAVASMAAFAIYLRERGSPESKLVGAPHYKTGEDSE